MTTPITCSPSRLYVIVMCAQEGKCVTPRTLSCGISRTCLTNVIEPFQQIRWYCADLEVTGSACKQSSLVHAAHMLQKVGGHFEALLGSGCREYVELAAQVNKKRTSSRTVCLTRIKRVAHLCKRDRVSVTLSWLSLDARGLAQSPCLLSQICKRQLGAQVRSLFASLLLGDLGCQLSIPHCFFQSCIKASESMIGALFQVLLRVSYCFLDVDLG